MTTLLPPRRSAQFGARSIGPRASGALCLGSVPEDFSQAFAPRFQLPHPLRRRSGPLQRRRESPKSHLLLPQ